MNRKPKANLRVTSATQIYFKQDEMLGNINYDEIISFLSEMIKKNELEIENEMEGEIDVIWTPLELD